MLSVIVPTYQEEKRLPACLEALVPQAAATGAEVLVVDGGSTDRTRAVAERHPIRLLDAPRGRGSQMNAGARAASGSLLLFLPADTLLPDGALERLATVDRAGTPAAGGFRQRFDADRTVLRCVSSLHNLRARVTRVFYGDQAPFVRRDLFLDLGGYREDVDMEDIELGERVRRRARPVQLPLVVTTSSRRFDRAGDLRATLDAGRLLLGRAVGRTKPRSDVFFTRVR